MRDGGRDTGQRHEETTISRRKRFTSRDDSRQHRINDEIRANEVRLIADDGEQLGEMPLPAARSAAERAELDLVEVAPHATPPVVRLMDYGKYEYEQSVKARHQRKPSGGTKEMKYRPNIGDHDFATKTRKVADFLRRGNEVKLTVWLRGRERSMPDLADDVVERVVDELDEMLDDEEVTIEAPVRGEGPQRSAVIAANAEE